MKDPCQRTPDVEEKILAAIRLGAYPEVAALAFGVPKGSYRNWLRDKKKGAAARPSAFAQKVEQAQATARLSAEMQTHQKDARLWLRAGPGKETSKTDGWTSFARPGTRKVRVLDSPAFLRLVLRIKQALAPYPEALAAVLHALRPRRRTKRRS